MHLSGDPLFNYYMILDMPEYADTKARRRRRIRETFPAPLNEIALRHVDSVQALNDPQRRLLADVLQKVGVHRLVDSIELLRQYGDQVHDQADLISRLEKAEERRSSQETFSFRLGEPAIGEDTQHLANLLVRCYPDMPQSSADALVASEVMAPSMLVVAATRRALQDAKSDFVIIALYTLFEERLKEIGQIISNNPAFVKAMRHSHPDWNTKH